MSVAVHHIGIGLAILGKHIGPKATLELCPIPESFPNGTPDFSRRAYISVEMKTDVDLTEQEETALKKLGWCEECNGDYWTYYD